MSGISPLKAFACLPLLGPLVASYNVKKANEIIHIRSAFSPVNPIVEWNATLALANGDRQEIQRTQQAKKEAILEHIANLKDLTKTSRSFSICGLIGDTLSIASLVTLVAFSILNPFPALCFGVFYSLHAYRSYKNLLNANKSLNTLQQPLLTPNLAAQPA